jgi:hypothetical protein
MFEDAGTSALSTRVLIRNPRSPPRNLRCVSRITNLMRYRVLTELPLLIDGRLALGHHIARILPELVVAPRTTNIPAKSTLAFISLPSVDLVSSHGDNSGGGSVP